MLLAYLLVTLCTAWTVAGLGAVLWTTNRRVRALEALPGVTILKPLSGADIGLERNLESFFQQKYPSYELVFGVQDEHDPAIAVVRRLRARYPEVACKLIIHHGTPGTNPKVRNLTGMLAFAANDLVIVSDSNVRAPRHYVRDMVQTRFRGDRPAGIVSNLFAGSREDALGSALENVQLNGFCAAGAALPTLFGDAAVIGKSMLFSRRTLDDLGGLCRVADVLAEDYVLGKLFQHAGYEVRIARTVLQNVTSRMSSADFMRRHLRWAMLRWRLRPPAYLLEVLTSPVALLPVAWTFLGPWALLWATAVLVTRDVGGWVALRGPRRAWIPLVLGPAKDVAMLIVWLRAPLKRHVSWRGHRVRLGPGTLLYPAR